jgi:TATA-box binding protein (TBP) (component of TFIID and TFIIIB)
MSEAIEKELKLSKKQNKNDRYNYLCSQFNGIEYAIKLEKYTNKLLKENKQLKQQLKDKDEKINKIEKLTKQLKGSARYERCMDELDYILNIIKED